MEAKEITFTLKEIIPVLVVCASIIWYLFYRGVLLPMKEDLSLIKKHILTCQAEMIESLGEKVDYPTFNTHRHPVDGPPLRG